MDKTGLRLIVRLAERLEPDRLAVHDWLFHTRIAMLGGHTAWELIIADRSEQVVVMLEKALRDEGAGGESC